MFTSEQIDEYIHSHTTPETDLLKELIRVSEEKLRHTDMISGRQVGCLLQLLIRLGGVRRVLEIGTFTGYSAITMADVLPEDGELITLEMNDLYCEISKSFFELDPYRNIIRQVKGDALETLETLKGTFDMIFIDADKLQYHSYFKHSKSLLRDGGVMIFDNMLWGGKVLDPDDPKSRSIHELNNLIQEDVSLTNVLLPVRDGVMLVYKNG